MKNGGIVLVLNSVVLYYIKIKIKQKNGFH